MHTQLQELHKQVFQAPFGKPKHIPHLLRRLFDLRGSYTLARELFTKFPADSQPTFSWIRRLQAVDQLVPILATMLVKKAAEVPRFDASCWDRSAVGRWKPPFRWEVDRMKSWWPHIHQAGLQRSEDLILPQEEHCRPIPPIPLIWES